MGNDVVGRVVVVGESVVGRIDALGPRLGKYAAVGSVDNVGLVVGPVLGTTLIVGTFDGAFDGP